MQFFVYILECADGSLYVGSTDDLVLRLARHNSGKGASWTAQRGPVTLVYSEPHSTRATAEARERQLKRWSHTKKAALVTGNRSTLTQVSRCRTQVAKEGSRGATAPIGLVLIFAITLSISATADAQTSDDFDRFIVPLIGPYVINSVPKERLGGEGGPHRLAERNSSPGLGLSLRILLENVMEVTVSGPHIVGKTKAGYFTFDSRAPDTRPSVFESAEQRHVALDAAAVPRTITLNDPKRLAASLPEQTLRPWKYSVMSGILGLSDSVWSLIVQIMRAILALLLGISFGRKRTPVAAAIALGLAINIVAMVIIAGEGPGAFAGFLLFPLLFWFNSWIGATVRQW